MTYELVRIHPSSSSLSLSYIIETKGAVMVVHAELKHSFGMHPRQLLDLMHDDKGDFVRRYVLR